MFGAVILKLTRQSSRPMKRIKLASSSKSLTAPSSDVTPSDDSFIIGRAVKEMNITFLHGCKNKEH